MLAWERRACYQPDEVLIDTRLLIILTDLYELDSTRAASCRIASRSTPGKHVTQFQCYKKTAWYETFLNMKEVLRRSISMLGGVRGRLKSILNIVWAGSHAWHSFSGNGGLLLTILVSLSWWVNAIVTSRSPPKNIGDSVVSMAMAKFSSGFIPVFPPRIYIPIMRISSWATAWELLSLQTG